MSELRKVKLEQGKAGMFSVVCATCPALVHLKAVGDPPWACIGGILTNVQGPVIIHRCKYVNGDDGLKPDGKKLFIDCMFEVTGAA